MHIDRDVYSSDESDNSDNSSDSGSDIEPLRLTCDADGKALCPCGCNRRRALRTVYQHLRNVRMSRNLSKKRSRPLEFDAPGAIDDLEAREDDGGLPGQMHEAEDHGLPGESNSHG